jgi:hypothetical protein
LNCCEGKFKQPTKTNKHYRLCLNESNKVKGKVVPVLNEGPCHENIWGSEGIAPHILILGSNGGEWSASHPDLFTLGERDPGFHWIGG